MNREQVLQDYRTAIREIILLRRELSDTPVPRGTTVQAHARALHARDSRREELRRQLDQLNAQAALLKKPFEECIGLCRSPSTRRALRLYYGMGLTDEQAAELMGLKAGTACKYRRRFIRLLNSMREV